MPITITRKLEFDYGHRVLGHESKCAFLHGHRGVAEVTVEAPDLDNLGRVVDFGVVKQLVGGWVDEHWDHNMLLHPEDPLIKAVRELNKTSPIQHEAAGWEDIVFGGGKIPYIMRHGNPTAENIAVELYHVASGLLPKPLRVVRVRIWETPNCHADYEGT